LELGSGRHTIADTSRVTQNSDGTNTGVQNVADIGLDLTASDGAGTLTARNGKLKVSVANHGVVGRERMGVGRAANGVVAHRKTLGNGAGRIEGPDLGVGEFSSLTFDNVFAVLPHGHGRALHNIAHNVGRESRGQARGQEQRSNRLDGVHFVGGGIRRLNRR
jgi:hypothetical protein